MADGLPSHLGDIGSESIKDASISNADLADSAVSGAKIADDGIGNAKLAASSVSGTKVDATIPVAATGSGTLAYGVSIQAGSAIASDAAVAVPFATSFAAAPIVIITPLESGALATQTYVDSDVGTGSFTFFGQSGLVHSWMAIGSGRV